MAVTTMADLKQAIFDMHGCDAVWVEAVPVSEQFLGKTVWKGMVQVFDPIGHPTASRCYAWAHTSKDRGRSFVAMLHQGAIDSPQAAVKAAIAQQLKRYRA
ncbi:MAG: hypothetical protein FJ039_02150 [Chloroflexi bacterium]|nr:hypothetical protein [Chloroflexota bacterium]